MIEAKLAFNNVLAWILKSSVNPGQISLTIKGMALTLIPIILTVTGLVHANNSVDATSLTVFFNSVGDLLTGVLTIVSLAMTFYGAARKIWVEVFGNSTTGPNTFSVGV